MTYILRWSLESKRTFDQNLDYLSEEWNVQVVNKFLDRVEEVLEKIRNNPEIYTLHRSRDMVYKCVVHKRIILYYKIIDDKNIDLLTFWNAYQDPDTMEL